jgi:hypothetical protein
MVRIGKEPQGISKRKAYDTSKAAAWLSKPKKLGKVIDMDDDSSPAVKTTRKKISEAEWRLKLSIDIASNLDAY